MASKLTGGANAAEKRKKRVIDIGGVKIGGNNRIAIQSMCNTKTEDIEATVNQVLQLEALGCDIIRLAVPSVEAARAISEIKKRVNIPIVADIHFDHRLALHSIACGADKIRINPGNIGSREKVAEVAREAALAGVPIRVGVNSGSVNRTDVAQYGRAEAMLRALRSEVALLEELGFYNIVLAVKSSDISETLAVSQAVDKLYEYPMHIGITETGTLYTGVVKSAAGLGILLNHGIGNTIRVSLAADPSEEIRCAKALLAALGIRRFGVNVIACPTCGRTNVDVIGLAERVEKALYGVKANIDVAVMGCAVNGPGEARDADIGVAGGSGEYLLFSKGEIVGKISENEVLDRLVEMAKEFELEA